MHWQKMHYKYFKNLFAFHLIENKNYLQISLTQIKLGIQFLFIQNMIKI